MNIPLSTRQKLTLTDDELRANQKDESSLKGDNWKILITKTIDERIFDERIYYQIIQLAEDSNRVVLYWSNPQLLPHDFVNRFIENNLKDIVYLEDLKKNLSRNVHSDPVVKKTLDYMDDIADGKTPTEALTDVKFEGSDPQSFEYNISREMQRIVDARNEKSLTTGNVVDEKIPVSEEKKSLKVSVRDGLDYKQHTGTKHLD